MHCLRSGRRTAPSVFGWAKSPQRAGMRLPLQLDKCQTGDSCAAGSGIAGRPAGSGHPPCLTVRQGANGQSSHRYLSSPEYGRQPRCHKCPMCDHSAASTAPDRVSSPCCTWQACRCWGLKPAESSHSLALWTCKSRPGTSQAVWSTRREINSCRRASAQRWAPSA